MNTINNENLVNTAARDLQLYDQYFGSGADVRTYLHEAQNPVSMARPDAFGLGDYFTNAYYDWQKNRWSVIKDTALGEYVKADQDINTITSAINYINATEQYQQAQANGATQDELNAILAGVEQYRPEYERLRNGGMHDETLNNQLNQYLDNGDLAGLRTRIAKETTSNGVIDPNTTYGKRQTALDAAGEYQDKALEYENKINSNYYRRMSQTDWDFNDIDSYLYKVPGLMGSSAATIEEQLATTAAAAASAAIAGSIGGLAGAAIGGVLGAAASIIGNISSRRQESNAEVYSAYKQKVQQDLDKAQLTNDILDEAKDQLIQKGHSDEEVNNLDYVWDAILTRQVKLDNVALDKAMTNNDGQLKALFERNMALSASDVVQTALSVLPTKVFTGVAGSAIRGAGKMGRTLGKTSDNVVGLTKKFKDRVDDIVAFGVDNVDKLPSLVRRRAILDLGGRIAISSVLEGAEEGSQYIFADKLLKGELNTDSSLLGNIANTYLTMGRAIIAGLTPFDPVYSSDKEFMENMKSGALLGGLMTGVVGTATSIPNTIRDTKAAAVLRDVYSDKFDQQDRVRKDILYSQYARNSRWDSMQNAFDTLASAHIEGVTAEDIEQERSRANETRNIATSKVTKEAAKNLGIDPRTEDYDIYVGLLSHHKQLVKDASINSLDKTMNLSNLLQDERIREHIQEIKPDATEEQITGIINLMAEKLRQDANEQLRNDLQAKADSQNEVHKTLKYSTSRADLLHLKSLSEKQGSNINIAEEAKKLGITVEQLEVPTMHDDLANSAYELAEAELLHKKAIAEEKLMHLRKGATQKIKKYKKVQELDDEYIQNLNDLYSGKAQQKAARKSEVETPQEVKQEEVERFTEPTTNEPTELTELRNRIKQNRQNTVETNNNKTRVRRDSLAGKSIDEANKELEYTYHQLYPDAVYNEYTAAERIDQNDQLADAWFNVIDARNALDEAIYSSTDISNPEQNSNIAELRNQLDETVNALKQARNSKPVEPSNTAEKEQEQQENASQQAQQRIQQKQEYTAPEIRITEVEPKPVSPVQEQPTTQEQQALPETATEEHIPTIDEIFAQDFGILVTETTTQEESETTTEPELQPLNYNPRLDPYSHELNYRLHGVDEQGRFVTTPYEGFENYLNNEALAEISTETDFIEQALRTAEFIVTKYNRKGNVEDAIYMTFTYNGKKYITNVTSFDRIDSLANRRFGNNRSYAEWQAIRQNLKDVHNKIIELSKVAAKTPGAKVVPTMLHRTNGQVINEKNSDGSPKNRSLLKSAWLAIKDPYRINSSNTRVGITTGPRSNRIIRFGNQILSGRGYAMGQAMLAVSVMPEEGKSKDILIKLNPRTFKNEPKTADLILNLLTSDEEMFVDANGVRTTIKNKDLLGFIVNFGPQTEFDPSNPNLDSSQIEQLKRKRFYINEQGNVIMGNNEYTINDLLTSETIRNQAKQYIMDNFHYGIEESSLLERQLGGDLSTPGQDYRFSSVKAFMLNNNVDKIVIIPGEFEFTAKDFGLTRNTEGKLVRDESLPNGISNLGQYIKQGVLQTDVADKLQNANIYFDDVRIKYPNESIPEPLSPNPAESTSTSNGAFTVVDETGKETVVDVESLLKRMDAASRKGPNMEVEATEDPTLMKNQENRMDVQQATKWLAETLGVEPEIVQGVVEVTEAGDYVLGRVTEDSILLSDLAVEGTQYHEAWHRVSQLLIDPNTRRKIYSKYKDLDERQIDEILAEQFRDFMVTQARTYNFQTNNWFRRIYDFIRLWVRTGQYGLAKIYSNINRGKYNGIKPSAENVTRFKQLYEWSGPNYQVNGYEFKHIQKQKQFDDICKSLVYMFFNPAVNRGSYISYEDMKANKPTFDRLKLVIQASLTKTPNEILQEVYDNFDNIFATEVGIRLKSYGLRAIDTNENDQISNKEEGAEGVDIGQHTVESMNISIKDNAPAEVKFFMSTIPQYEQGVDGKYIFKQDPSTHFPMFVDTTVAWTKILKDLHNCRSIAALLQKANMLAQNGDMFYKALTFKLQRVIDESLNGSANAEALLTKIEIVVTSDVNNFVTVKVSKEGDNVSFAIKNNQVDITAANYPKVWSQYLFNNSALFEYADNGEVKATNNAKYNLGRIIDELKAIRTAFTQNSGILRLNGNNIDLHNPANIETLKKFVVSRLNSVGIGIDVQTINNMLISGDYGNPIADQYTLMNSFLNNNTSYGGFGNILNTLQQIHKSIQSDGKLSKITIYDEEVKPTSIWNNNGFVKELANYYAYTHVTDSSLGSLGPDGNKYYMVSQNNFAKDRINELNTDQQVRDQLNSAVYNQNSLLLRAANSGQKLSIETFINFRDDTSSYDYGRDYFSITDREDYLAKMAFVMNDRIIFPTVADKKTYHLINGVKLPHERIQFQKLENGNYAVKFGENTLNTILGYCYDELNQIELCLRQIDDDPAHFRNGVHYNADGTVNKDWLPKEKRIKNFHTPNTYKYKDGNGVEQTVTLEGNGARFLFLTGIQTNKGFISFNDPKKTALENLQTAKDYFFNLTPETQKLFLSSLLNQRVKEEIQYGLDNGIIKGNNRDSIWSLRNNLLDTVELRSRSNNYLAYDSANAEGFGIYDMFADYTVNSIISVMEVEKLFSGSPAYYKVKYDRQGITDISVDKIKRLGALTSTGLNNRLDFFNSPLDTDEYTVAELKDHEVASRQLDTYRTYFLRGNIKESIIEMYGFDAWNESKNLTTEQLKEKYPEAYNYAEAATKREIEGYEEGINVADAAVYISPEMTKNLLRMRGVWSDDIRKAFDILTNPETADTWESDPTLYTKANKVILNAMKYVAFGNRFDIPGLSIPYFNKMALFPVFKSVATGDMSKLYERMTDPDPSKRVDMFMFNSAVKAGSQNPAKAYRNATDSEIELKDGQTILSAELQDRIEAGYKVMNELDNITTYKQKYKYIRQQLETNPHTHEEQMLGTQFMKVGLSNLRMQDEYGVEGDKVSGQSIKDTIIESLNVLSDLGRQQIESELFDKNGEVDMNALAYMLLSDARESGANDNIISALKIKDGKFVVPLSAMSDNKWLESRFTSMLYKTIVDVNMPGGAFIQRSVFGEEASSLDVVTPNMVGDGKYLLSINEKDGSMDSVVSINLFKHIIPNYNKMTFIEAKQWLIDHNIIGRNANATAVGYRIPTQSIASISALRFVDVFPEIMGDTIMLPEDFTKLTGSDKFIVRVKLL